MMDNKKEIFFEEIKGEGGNIGVITLNRPEVLNALTYNMCQQMNRYLDAWEQNSDIKAVIIQSNEKRAFCAGGDIRKIYDLGQEKRFDEALAFFKEEYTLNHKIHHYTKPYIALLDGITMGGGLGLSIHGSHRVATLNMSLAMPETAIGFFPDIGGSYFLSRCPFEMGIYLGLTGHRIQAADALAIGLIDHLVLSTSLSEIVAKIISTPFDEDPHTCVTNILREFNLNDVSSTLMYHAHDIQSCFNAENVMDIIERLQEKRTPWADETLTALKAKSPTSLKVTLLQLRKGFQLNLTECLAMEYTMVSHFLHEHDFYEGIRAMLVDKDKNPQWQPAELEDVNEQRIKAYFNLKN
jgi:enoyl-CoA hydratase